MTKTWHDTTANVLTFGVQVARDLERTPEGSDQWQETANDVLSSFLIAALLAEVRALDPAAAEKVVGLANEILEGDSHVVREMLIQWGHAFNGGHDFRLTEVPDVDESGLIWTPEQRAEANRHALHALEELHKVDPEYAATLRALWEDPERSFDVADLVRLAGTAVRQHASTHRPATYAQHHEPRR